MSPFLLLRSHQVAIGVDRFRVWLDSRGLTLDYGRRRFTWRRPGARLLFHERRIPARWYGRVISAANPNLSTGRTI